MVNPGWQPPAHAVRFLAAIAAVVIVAWGYVTLPSGCETPAPSRSRTALPGSPLEKNVDGTATTASTGDLRVIEDPGKPKLPPPQERPLPPTAEPNIRVRVASLRSEPVVLSHPSGWLWLKGESAEQGRTFRTPIAASPADGGWRIVEANGTAQASTFRLKEGGSLQVKAPQNAPGGIQYGGASYPGDATIARRTEADSGAADLVFTVPLETYLPGVLAKELYKGWHQGAYEAQAIAARSFAACEMEWWRNRRHFDVVAGQASQAWVGATTDAKSLDAVRTTRGQYLVFDGRVVPAYYSSCCGGEPSSAVDSIRDGTWTKIAPLTIGASARGMRTQCCEKSPTSKWQASFSASETADRMNAWSRQAGRKDLGPINGIKSFTVAQRNPANRPMSFLVVDKSGKRFAWDAEDFRIAVNSGADGSRDSLKSSALEPRVESGRLLLDGRGHGHGAGMCQYGAETMAKAGKSPQAILARYYPGSTIVTMSEGTSDAPAAQANVRQP
ncbi:MAG: SpoIID/LytB domain-containing protein [Planctomycetes bacterium]|nr:SpoIID/LytB domain-containing protein [Planctomycetota bacterium]